MAWTRSPSGGRTPFTGGHVGGLGEWPLRRRGEGWARGPSDKHEGGLGTRWRPPLHPSGSSLRSSRSGSGGAIADPVMMAADLVAAATDRGALARAERGAANRAPSAMAVRQRRTGAAEPGLVKARYGLFFFFYSIYRDGHLNRLVKSRLTVTVCLM